MVTAILILFALGTTIFIYNTIIIPISNHNTELRIRKEIDDSAMPKVKAAVVIDEAGINKYTLLTDELISKKIKVMDIPVKYAPQHVISDIGILKDKITKEDLHFGEQIISDSLSTDKKWFGEYDRLKEFTVSGIVAGELKTGNIVDMIVSYGNGDYDIVVPKIKVKKLVYKAAAATLPPASGKQDSKTQKSNSTSTVTNKADDKAGGLYTLILAVDEEQYRDLELAGKLGKFVTRMYLDESQPASKKTFDYYKGLSLLNIQDASTKDMASVGINQEYEDQNRTGNTEVGGNTGQLPAIKFEN